MATKQFTLRVGSEIYDQVVARARVLKRSVNKEIETLLAWAIERQTQADEDSFKKMRDHLEGRGREPSGTAAALGLPARS